jgi:DNA-binding transcriptional ArsR family regulator
MASNGVAVNNHWYLVSSHGSVLFYIALNPDCTIREIADDMALTQRTVWGLIGDLRRAGMLHVQREGRRHHYTVNLDAAFKHPILNGLPLRLILGELVERYAQPRHAREREASLAS